MIHTTLGEEGQYFLLPLCVAALHQRQWKLRKFESAAATAPVTVKEGREGREGVHFATPRTTLAEDGSK